MQTQNRKIRDLLDEITLKKEYVSVLSQVIADDLEKLKKSSREKKYSQLAYEVDHLVGERHEALFNLMYTNLREIDELAQEAQTACFEMGVVANES